MALLGDEIEQEQAPPEMIAEDRADRLNAMAESLAKSRSEAINARQASGVEDDWAEDEEFYMGMDDANRGEFNSNTWRQKPPGSAGQPAVGTTRSTVFPNITGPYVDAAAARISDMLLPTDDRAWGLKPTPIPEMVALAKGKVTQGLAREAAGMYPGQPQLAKQRIAQAVAEATAAMEAAKEKAGRAQTRIEDWHIECQYHSHVRAVIEDAARIGTGVLKGPIPLEQRRIALADGGIQVVKQIKPGSKRVDPWNCFPDPACGENIHNGSFFWERDFITKKQLRELKGQEGYFDGQIEACIEEGATRAIAEFKPTADILVSDVKQRDRYEIWYFHGTAERDDILAAGCDCGELKDPNIPVMVTMVNNRAIRVSMNPLDTGDFPYDVMVWRRRSGHWTGTGVTRQIRTAQRIVTAATRNLMDNAGIAAGPMLVFRQGVVYPADGVAGIAPRKVYYIAQDADEMVDATKAIGVVKVDMLVAELMEIIQLGLKLAEYVTGLPMILQGQQGQAPDTVGGLKLLNNNASSVLRRLARLFDDLITEPHIRRYYVWLLQHGEDEEKGDFSIDARGSSALVERDIQNQELGQMGAIVLDPRFGLDPKKWAKEMLKSRHFDVKRFEYDDEQWQQIIENMSQGKQDPRLAVAELKAKMDAQILQLEQAFEAAENQKDRDLEKMLKGIEAEIERERGAGAKDISLDRLKGLLSDTVIKVRAQGEMQKREHAVQITKPPVEPKGRAKAGRAYTQ